MSSDIALIEVVRAEIEAFMRTNGHDIASTLLHYKEQGRIVYEILKESSFIVRLFHPRIFVGNYPCKGGQLALFVGTGRGKGLYYKVISDEKDKNA